jgi:hypothetical protein
MDDRTDRDTETTDRQVAATVAAVLVAYDRLVPNGDPQARRQFVRFAALRLATVLRIITLTVDALVTALLTRSRRQYVPVIPNSYHNATERLETAFQTILADEPAPAVEDVPEDEPLPEPDEPLEAISEVELPAEMEAPADAETETDTDDETDAFTPDENISGEDEAEEVEETATDGESGIEELRRQAEQEREARAQDRREAAEERRQAAEERRQAKRERRDEERQRQRDLTERQKRNDQEARAEAKRIIREIAEQAAADDAQAEDYQDEPDSPEDQAILAEYTRTVERAAERQRSRIERLIQTEIKTTSRQAFAEALGKRKMSAVWISRPTACPICTTLDGTVIGPGEKVPTSHPGCSCRIRPVLVIDDPYVTTGAAA